MTTLTDWRKTELGLYVPPPARRRYDLPVAVDLFCGAGGFSLGFHEAGFHVAAAVEYDVDSSLTYLTNLARPGVEIHIDPQHPRLGARSSRPSKRKAARKPIPFDVHIGTGWIAGQPADHRGCEHFYIYDVRNLTGQRILNDLGLEPGDVAVVIGGPPCQGFSRAGQQNVMDPRNSLVFEFARLVCEIQPRAFVMENVPGMLDMTTPEGIPVMDAICYACASGGYGDYEALRKALGVTGARAGFRSARSSCNSSPAVDREPTLFEVDAS
ncbi:DNA cytosine methyltransferase [Mycobacterium heckeshornense]|uniref:DNA cytosine methyltransferase n=1 Tax=Mycobacterium heckeshornense TaxID=110505 RepID=UPI0006627E03|nr:DNA cytosine methyltransferase [Mycobacterium heckeshornense]